jgi:hypothetical protein
LTEQDIIKSLSLWTDNRKFPYQLPNSFVYAWECDFWTMTSGGETREFEIKISRSDFLADSKKDKHKVDTGANFFYYVCPKDLIKLSEVNKKYGLIYIWETGFVEIKKRPVRLNNNVFDRWKMLANKMYSKWYLIWKQKWIEKEISHSEYRDGFNMQLFESELMESIAEN